MSATLKNVVVIGGASGGAQVAHALEKTLPKDYRLVLIESNEFAYWPIAGLRAAVKPGYEDQVFASFDDFFGKEESRHVVLSGYKVIELTEDSVKLDRAAPAPFEGDTIPVEVGILSVGTDYAIPMRPMSTKLAEAKEGLRTMQKEIAEAKHILVVGGGAVGVEFAGEVVYNHPDKKVTIVDMSDGLVQGYRAALGQSLLNQLEKKKVEVLLNTGLELTKEHFEQSQRLQAEPLKINLSNGTVIETDFLFIATGGKPNTGLVPQDALDDGKPRRFDVNSGTLRMSHPTFAKKWFAMGDASNAPGAKTHVSATNQTPIVAAQVTSLITNSSVSTKVYKTPSSVIAVPIGENGGASQIFYPVFGEWFTTLIKSKSLFLDVFLKAYPAGTAA
ncbi:hypothetical protein CBS101457_004772 [Exobasidium rhododendri]|nr:hypothetical protein CBS101457_004772 [Exobasidium rhododendri]